MKETILLVDDDKIFSGEMTACLEDEYQVIYASSGDEAVNIIKKPNNIDLILLDIRMPGLNGIDILKKIKISDPEIPAVILTGYSTKDTAIESLKAHADDYIEKSFDINKIKDIIRKNIEVKRGDYLTGNLDIKGKIEKVKYFIDRNAEKIVNLKDAAKNVGWSVKYLSKIFRQVTGITFNEYRLKIKMIRAKELLKKTGYNIDQIADKMNYMNTESFIRIFKKITGMTPSQYRNKFKNKRKK